MLRSEPDSTMAGLVQYQVVLMSRQARTSKDLQSSLDSVIAQGCTVVRPAIVFNFSFF